MTKNCFNCNAMDEIAEHPKIKYKLDNCKYVVKSGVTLALIRHSYTSVLYSKCCKQKERKKIPKFRNLVFLKENQRAGNGR